MNFFYLKKKCISICDVELESRVKESSQEIQDLKILVEAQENRIKNLMDQITEAHVREQDKEGEISSFQKGKSSLI